MEKNGTEVTSWNLLWTVIDNSNDETNFLSKLLLNDTQVLRLCKVFPNGLLSNLKLWKTHLSKVRRRIFTTS